MAFAILLGMYAGHHVSIILPAHNEEQSIALVLEQLGSVAAETGGGLTGPGSVDEVVVCNNGSTDRTGDLARSVADRHGWQVIEESRPGYGAACHAAVSGLSGKAGEEIVVFIDADASVAIEEIPLLLAEIVDGADLVIGNRIKARREAGAMTPPQRAGNRFAALLVWLLWRRRFSDFGPFRAIRRSCLDQINMRDRRFGWTVEMQVRAIQLELDVREVPVSVRKRIGRSKISGTARGVLLAGHDMMSTIFKLYIEEKMGTGSVHRVNPERSV